MSISFRSSKAMKLRPPPQYLWKPFIPTGRVTLVDGEPGIGKGLLCVHLVLLVVRQGINAMWFTAEDDPEEDIYRRLMAAGYDPERDGEVFFHDGSGGDDKMAGFPRDIRKLYEDIETIKPGIVVMDPGKSFLVGTKDANSNGTEEERVRPGLQKLNQVAAKTQVAMPFIHHWNRDASRKPSERFAGSAAYAQVARHRVTMARYGSDDGGERCMAITKSNISTIGHPRYYVVDPVPEMETAKWLDGGPNHKDESLDAWWRRMERVSREALDQSGFVIEWLEENSVTGSAIPSRDEILDAIEGCTQMDVKKALTALRKEGKIRTAGPRGNIWEG